MLRIGLNLAANLAILAVLSVAFRLFGIDSLLAANGFDLNLTALLIFATLLGFARSLISLFMSKTMAKAAMGVHVIANPRDATERWLVQTVHAQADRAGIGRPEVGIFDHPLPLRNPLEQ